jgi:phospholipase A-2-activating protein
MIYTDDASAAYFTTSGEDRTLRIHSVSNNQADIKQSIALPAQSLWYAVCLPNGNIAVACSDGSIRLFTQNESLMATKTEQEEYEKELAQFTIPLKANEQMSQLNRDELPGIEALSIPGRKDGQPLLINNNDETEVYQWDGAEQKWIKIGVAVGSSGSGGGSGSKQKVTYLGKVKHKSVISLLSLN